MFLSDLKTNIGRVPDGDLFFTIGRWIGVFFLLLLGKYHQTIVIRVENENCEFPLNLCTDVLVASSVETPWIFTPCPLKQRKVTV